MFVPFLSFAWSGGVGFVDQFDPIIPAGVHLDRG
jgi:hypothetical protein